MIHCHMDLVIEILSNLVQIAGHALCFSALLLLVKISVKMNEHFFNRNRKLFFLLCTRRNEKFVSFTQEIKHRECPEHSVPASSCRSHQHLPLQRSPGRTTQLTPIKPFKWKEENSSYAKMITLAEITLI